MIRWGLSATIKAPASDVLKFTAHHLDLGAHRLYIYLDAPNRAAFDTLKAHPKVRVTQCDEAHWRKLGGKRPTKHQVRQSLNATHAYNRRAETDWLIHMDVDEFLWPETSVEATLDAVDPGVLSARIRPIESIAGDGSYFKAFLPPGPEREATVERLYPRFGRFVKGGFLSHVAGKLFLRSGMPEISVRIHNAFQGDRMNPGETELADIALCHCHATSWEDWLSNFHFRHSQGSYRADLAPALAPEKGGMTLHDMLAGLEAEKGETGLRAFYDELCGDTPELRNRLDSAGLLRRCHLDLDAKLLKHFENFRPTVD